MVTVFVQYLPGSVVHHMGRRGIQLIIQYNYWQILKQVFYYDYSLSWLLYSFCISSSTGQQKRVDRCPYLSLVLLVNNKNWVLSHLCMQHVQILILLKRPVWVGVVILIPFVTTLAVHMKTRRFNYSAVVLIGGNEKQEKYSWYKTYKQPEVSTTPWWEERKRKTRWQRTIRLDRATLST